MRLYEALNKGLDDLTSFSSPLNLARGSWQSQFFVNVYLVGIHNPGLPKFVFYRVSSNQIQGLSLQPSRYRAEVTFVLFSEDQSVVGWFPSAEDILAFDWEVVNSKDFSWVTDPRWE